MLEIKNLKAEINNKKIIKGLNLKINQGEVHAIMGPNGSGKSTLLHLLLGLLQPNSGLVLMDNLDIKKNFDKLKHNFG